jgi:glucose/arabinose dehydrogenase
MMKLGNLFGSRNPGKRRRSLALRPAGLDGLERRELLTTLPAGFTESTIASGFSFSTSLSQLPDGRLLVGQADGTVRVVKDDVLQPQPFARFEVDRTGSQGLMQVFADPHFEHNGTLYAYYVTPTRNNQQRNRLVAFQAEGDAMKPGTEKVLYESAPFLIPPGTPAHDGGGVTFGADGKIYIPTGDMLDKTHSQRLDNPFGKVLRINPDGSIPTDNPFYNVVTGDNRLIYALGLRNPFTIAAQPGTGRIYINDVGSAMFEEVNELVAGANYGYPDVEGPSTDPRFTNPIHYYTHLDPDAAVGGTSIVGGAFYDPASPSFPEAYSGKYFFADHNNRWMKTLDPATRQVVPFAQDLEPGLVDIEVLPDGRIAYLTVNGELREIQYAPAAPPTIPNLPDQTVRPGQTAVFRVSPRGSGPFLYQWQVNDQNVPGGNGPQLELGGLPVADGAKVRVIVTNGYGTSTSNVATLRLNTNQPPVVRMTAPRPNQVVRVGRFVQFAGSATDPEDRRLRPKAFVWTLDLLHNDHVHPAVFRLAGRTGGRVLLPKHAEDGQVRFRLNLTVTDSKGDSTTVSRVLTPTPVTPRPPRPGRPRAAATAPAHDHATHSHG